MGKAAIGVEHEGGALEDEFVLATKLVEIDHRQAALDDAGDGDVEPLLDHAAAEGRAVRDQQDLAAGLSDTLDDFLAPDVLADRNAQADMVAEDDRAGQRAGLEHALLVEDAVIGQVDLEAHRLDQAAIEQRIGVVELAVLEPGQSDEHGRAAIGGLAGEVLAGLAAGILEGRLQHQILRRIGREEEFGEHHELGAAGSRLAAGGPNLLRIAGDVADDRVELGERQAEGRLGHALDVACGPRASNGAASGPPLRFRKGAQASIERKSADQRSSRKGRTVCVVSS